MEVTFEEIPYMGRFVYRGQCYIRIGLYGEDIQTPRYGLINAVCYDGGMDNDRGIWQFSLSDLVVPIK